MSERFDHATITKDGRTYQIAYVYDHGGGEPWKNSDGHGIVSGWETREPEPGERILSTDREAHRFYDVTATLALATRDQWGAHDGPRDGESADAYTARAVQEDFEYLHAWCHDEWHYCDVIATLLDHHGEPTDHTASMGGVETWKDYHKSDSLLADVIGEIVAELAKGEALDPRVDPNPDVNFLNDAIQFPRLLAEIAAAGLTKKQTLALSASMDLPLGDITVLLDRAEATWDAIKIRMGDAIKK